MPWEKSRDSLEGGAGIVWAGAFRVPVTEMTAHVKWLMDARTRDVSEGPGKRRRRG